VNGGTALPILLTAAGSRAADASRTADLYRSLFGISVAVYVLVLAWQTAAVLCRRGEAGWPSDARAVATAAILTVLVLLGMELASRPKTARSDPHATSWAARPRGAAG
jgi:hypothetical protein